jgi:hypothetical protein
MLVRSATAHKRVITDQLGSNGLKLDKKAATTWRKVDVWDWPGARRSIDHVGVPFKVQGDRKVQEIQEHASFLTSVARFLVFHLGAAVGEATVESR